MNEGTLYVVATPIGHLGDLSPRAVEVLGSVELIAAEDTRVTRKLLQHAGLATPMLSLHEHNERQRIETILERLAAGQQVALVSDAGTPLISDPGYPLVSAVRAAGYPVVPVPGPCALVAALSVSGLPTDRFVFEGFLPSKPASRRARLDALRDETRTLVFYESPHRVLACLEDMRGCFGDDRVAVVAREISKTFETIRQGSLAELCDWMAADANQQRGEFVILADGAPTPAQNAAKLDEDRLLATLMEELPLKQAAALAARICGGKRNDFYQKALEIKELKPK